MLLIKGDKHDWHLQSDTELSRNVLTSILQFHQAESYTLFTLSWKKSFTAILFTYENMLTPHAPAY